MPELNDLFNAGSHKKPGVEATTDATATQEDVIPSEESGIVQSQVEETPNVETVMPETEGESTQDEVDFKALYEAEKQKRESAEKQYRDNQSYNDRRFNELQNQFNSFKEVESKPKEKEYTAEELSDLQYNDPEKWFEIMANKFGYSKPDANQDQPNNFNDRLLIQEEVQRELHDDYDDVVAKFIAVKDFHPEALKRVQEAPNRAKAAYEEGKKLQNANTNSVDAEALKEQLRAEILKEMEEGKKTTTNLRKVPSSAPTKGKVTNNNDSLGGLFKAGKRR